MSDRSLRVWLHGVHVATITTSGPMRVTCRYTPEAIERWPGGAPLLSCSLPLASTRYRDAGVWFRGLLPEGRALQAMADAAQVPTYDTFGMLARFGRDVAGAVVIADADPGPRHGSVAPYTGDALDDEIAGLEDRPLALYDDSELSLPGLQNKLLLVELDDGWGRPVGGRPSTHILKVEDRRYPGLATMEAACLHLARAVGLTTIDAAVETHADVDCLIVSRFDRTVVDDTLDRIHQEDACQALGRDLEANDRRGKYEAFGGPSFREVAELLDRYAEDPIHELTRLVSAATFTVAIGNADAHGKNIGFLHEPPGNVRLAPLYDTVPTVLWPKLPTRAAMQINERTDIREVTLSDLVSEATSWRMDPARAEEAARATIDGLLEGLKEEGDAVPRKLKAHVRDRCRELTS